MKTKVLLLAAIVLSSIAPVQAGDFGLGIILGEPTGISFKQWASDRKTSIHGAVAWAFGGRNAALHVHLDHVWHNYEWFEGERRKEGNLPIDFSVYYGLGGRLKLESQNLIGLRIPVGVNYTIPQSTLEFFVEVVPVFDLMPRTGFGLNLGLGGRIFL